MKHFKLFLFLTFALFALSTSAPPASALLITPDKALMFGNKVAVPAIDSILENNEVGTEYYKYAADGIESGPLAGSYSTVYNSIFSGGTITFTGGDYISENPFLLVKDGNNEPAWYLFDLGIDGLKWDGMETLGLQDFWSNIPGDISHVALYGDDTTPVPVTGAIWLLGGGLVGLAGFRKWRKGRRD